MLESINIVAAATFDATPQVMNGLSRFNYVFGANGTGKTTLSRIFATPSTYPTCSLNWKNGTPLECVVYNRDFVSANFHECDELPGIFTLGEKNAETIQKITKAKREHERLVQELGQLRTTLNGSNGFDGKLAELAKIEDCFKEACWSQKQKHDLTFKVAFKNLRNNQEKFKERVLAESKSSNAELCDLAELVDRAATVFADSPSQAAPISSIDHTGLLRCESDPILTKRVVGKSDVNIAALIERLGNSDWVRTGRTYYQEADGLCPFCQTPTIASLENELNEYFDDAFETDSLAISALESQYASEFALITQQLEDILSSPSSFLDVKQLEDERDMFASKAALNLQHIRRKKKEPSG